MKVAKPLLRTSISLLVLLSLCYELALSRGHQVSLEKAKDIQFYDSNAHSRGSNDGDCWLQPYVDFHAAAVQSLRHAQCVPSLVYVCDKNCGGVGDRMSGIISAFYLAVALDRAFFIDYKSPFPLTETLIPKTVRWDYKVNRKCTAASGFRSKENEIFMVDSENPEKVLRRIEQLHESGTSTIRLHINRYYVGVLLWKAPSSSKHSERTRAAFESKMLRKLDVYCRDRNAIENTAGYTFSFAFTHLFDFASEVKDRASQMTQELALGADAEFIAVHIRLGGRQKQSNRVVGWVDPKRHEMEDAASFFDCADAKRRHTGTISRSSPIVLFSDNEEVKRAPIVAARSVRVVESTHISHTDRSWSFSKKSMRRGNIDTFAELYLMSRASCIVGSNSTYSGLASSLKFPPHACFSYFGNCTESRWDFWTETEPRILRL